MQADVLHEFGADWDLAKGYHLVLCWSEWHMVARWILSWACALGVGHSHQQLLSYSFNDEALAKFSVGRGYIIK
jgi:hypothetical protein